MIVPCMPAKRRASNRYSNQQFMGAGNANRTVDRAVDGMIGIGTMYTAGMVGIGLLGAIKGSFK